MLHQAQSIEGVQAAALTSSLPISNALVRTRLNTPRPASLADATTIMPIVQSVTRDYFRVMGIPVLAGRTFDARDAASKRKVAIVNQAFVRQYFSGEDPVGKSIQSPDNKGTSAISIVGVVRDAPFLDLAETPEPEIYFNFDQSLMTPFLTGLAVRTRDNPQALGNALRAALSLKNTDQAVVRVRTLQTLIDENVWQPRFAAWLFSAFAGIALGLSGIGIYGVIAYVTTARRREFGIRLSLGASPAGIFRFAARQSLTPIALGACLGALGSYWAGQWISSLLYKTGPLDPAAAFVSAAILLFLALAATAGPALRASRVDPAITLRHE